jgi:hypothetical protein
VSSRAALDWALAQVGTVEAPPFSNKGPGITQWEVDSGYAWVLHAAEGVPWCQCFANHVAVVGGAPQLNTGYTPAVLRGIGDFTPCSVDEADPGDFIYFKWPGSHDPCDHVGVLISKTSTTVTCVEGNTSFSDSGSQNNGGCVAVKTRSRALTVGAVQVPYTFPEAYRNFKLGVQGDDVTAFQLATNRHALGCNRPDRLVTVDSLYGPETKENGAWAAFILGIGESTDDIKAGGISSTVQNLSRHPDQRNAVEILRAADRRKEHCKPKT